MGLDIRLPIGLMFTIFGLLLAGYGLLGDKVIYERSLGININLTWGAVMLLFGVAMLVLGRRGGSAMHSSEDSLEGRVMMKEMEQRAGHEKPKRDH